MIFLDQLCLPRDPVEGFGLSSKLFIIVYVENNGNVSLL